MLRNSLLMMAMMLFVAIAPDARAATADDAKQFVDGVGKRVLGIVNGSGGEAQKQKELQQMFSDTVDIPWMGQFVLGHAWQQATEDQRNRYLQAYKQYLLARYTTNFADYTGAKYTITDAKPEEGGQFTVNMQINAPKQSQDTLAGYRLRPGEGGAFKITDIIIEGVSLITTQRSDFSSTVQSGGIDTLIKDLEAKAQTEKQKS
jgi:phospholipid transport system substrate-binding protein